MPEPVAPARHDELRRALTRWKLASFALAGALLIALGALALLLGARPAAAPIVADDEPPRRRPRRSDDEPSRTTARSFEDDVAAQLRRAAEAAGWKVVSENRAKVDGLVQITVSATQGGAYLFLMVAEAKDEATAESIASGYATLASRGWICRREGRRVYTVSITNPTATTASAPGTLSTAAAASASASAVLDVIVPGGRP